MGRKFSGLWRHWWTGTSGYSSRQRSPCQPQSQALSEWTGKTVSNNDERRVYYIKHISNLSFTVMIFETSKGKS